MDQDWILMTLETRRTFAASTWVPLRAAMTHQYGGSDVKLPGYISDDFMCGSVAFPPAHREAAERLGWGDIGIGHAARPFAYEDGYYSPIEEYQYNDKHPLGVELIFVHDQPVVGGQQWILSPDLVIALRLIKEGHQWVRPEEDFVVVARETISERGHTLIEIKREFLLDYLSARGLALRLSYFRQRVETVESEEGGPYAALENNDGPRDGGRFSLLKRTLNDVYGGSWALFRMWRTDVDPEEDAPVMGPERNDNTQSEQRQGHRGGYEGMRIEGQFWRDEWIEPSGRSVRVRGDHDTSLPSFIVDTDGTRLPSAELDDEDIGRWLWFRPGVVNALLGRRGFSLEWYTAETGAIHSTSGYHAHFGLNSADLLTVYAYDVARLPAWEQHLWAAHNVAPEGKVSAELLASQVAVKPASTKAPEELLIVGMRMLERDFGRHFGVTLFLRDIDEGDVIQHVSRFASQDQPSLLRLAKELIRVFSDRLDTRELRKLATHEDKDKFGSNKLLQDVLTTRIGEEAARDIFRHIVGAYEMRLGDAHPTSSKIADALALAGIDPQGSPLRQGQQLIDNFARALWRIGRSLFGSNQGE